jgi:hypothetical protein
MRKLGQIRRRKENAMATSKESDERIALAAQREKLRRSARLIGRAQVHAHEDGDVNGDDANDGV